MMAIIVLAYACCVLLIIILRCCILELGVVRGYVLWHQAELGICGTLLSPVEGKGEENSYEL